ncbi:MAG: M67 family metallopeptidase [Bacillota bacterium]
MSESLVIPPRLQRRLIRWARQQAPREICGALVGRDGRVDRVLPARNADPDPRRFCMDPGDLVTIFQYIEQSDQDLLGFYHSHPSGPGTPSTTDLAEAFYPAQLMVIVYPGDGKRPIRAFRVGEQVEEVHVDQDSRTDPP